MSGRRKSQKQAAEATDKCTQHDGSIYIKPTLKKNRHKSLDVYGDNISVFVPNPKKFAEFTGVL